MSTTATRLLTLRALAAAARARSGLASFEHVDHELQELSRSGKVTPERRRHLLQIFHGMRALETALKEVVRSYGQDPKTTLGQVLRQMNGFAAGHPAHLSARELNRFMINVRVVRNDLMHKANNFPKNAKERDKTLGEVSACFVLLVN